MDKNKQENNIEYFIEQLRNNKQFEDVIKEIVAKALNHSSQRSS